MLRATAIWVGGPSRLSPKAGGGIRSFWLVGCRSVLWLLPQASLLGVATQWSLCGWHPSRDHRRVSYIFHVSAGSLGCRLTLPPGPETVATGRHSRLVWEPCCGSRFGFCEPREWWFLLLSVWSLSPHPFPRVLLRPVPCRFPLLPPPCRWPPHGGYGPCGCRPPLPGGPLPGCCGPCGCHPQGGVGKGLSNVLGWRSLDGGQRL